MTINLTNILATLDEIAKVAPIIATATGLPTTGIVSELAEVLPEVETALAALLNVFTKHAATIAATTTTPPAAA